jgi:hypothetical protein
VSTTWTTSRSRPRSSCCASAPSGQTASRHHRAWCPSPGDAAFDLRGALQRGVTTPRPRTETAGRFTTLKGPKPQVERDQAPRSPRRTHPRVPPEGCLSQTDSGSAGRRATDIGAFPAEQRIEARPRAGFSPQAFTDRSDDRPIDDNRTISVATDLRLAPLRYGPFVKDLKDPPRPTPRSTAVPTTPSAAARSSTPTRFTMVTTRTRTEAPVARASRSRRTRRRPPETTRASSTCT